MAGAWTTGPGCVRAWCGADRPEEGLGSKVPRDPAALEPACVGLSGWLEGSVLGLGRNIICSFCHTWDSCSLTDMPCCPFSIGECSRVCWQPSHCPVVRLWETRRLCGLICFNVFLAAELKEKLQSEMEKNARMIEVDVVRNVILG